MSDLPNEMAEENKLQLNVGQEKAYYNLRKFIESKRIDFMLKGPGGTGKTTVVVNAFNGSNEQIAFCAFTNKATQVLRTIASKFNINFEANFMTIHKLLSLEPKYLDNENELAFTFDKNKVIDMANYKYIIFDEVSTISSTLYGYMMEAREFIKFKYDVDIKYIYLGDYYQLSPVGEKKSPVFKLAKELKWPVSTLTEVMRYDNDKIRIINERMLELRDLFKERNVKSFIKDFPYNMVPRKTGVYLSLDNLLEKYISTWDEGNPDTVILTYSRANCEKINYDIQDRLDMKADRELPEKRKLEKFHVGDRCCIDKPIDVYRIKEQSNKKPDYNNLEILDIALEYISGNYVSVIPGGHNDLELFSDIDEKEDLRTVYLDTSTNETLYNGEIFDVLSVEDVKIITSLNKLKFLPKYFNGQILKLKRINEEGTYDVLHIPDEIIQNAKKELYIRTSRAFRLNILTEFIKKYPKLTYGYCITVYKSIGSEWHTVFVNLNSIKWSIVGATTNAEFEKKESLYSTAYTALSRASNSIYCLWNN
jgi:hypothetical protein